MVRGSKFSNSERAVAAACLVVVGAIAYLLTSNDTFAPGDARRPAGVQVELGTLGQRVNDVRLRPSASLAWTPAPVNTPIFNGDAIYAGARSSARVKMNEGADVQINENSLIRFDTIAEQKLANLSLGTFKLVVSGRARLAIRGRIATLDGSHAEVMVTVPEREAPTVELLSGASGLILEPATVVDQTTTKPPEVAVTLEKNIPVPIAAPSVSEPIELPGDAAPPAPPEVREEAPPPILEAPVRPSRPEPVPTAKPAPPAAVEPPPVAPTAPAPPRLPRLHRSRLVVSGGFAHLGYSQSGGGGRDTVSFGRSTMNNLAAGFDYEHASGFGVAAEYSRLGVRPETAGQEISNQPDFNVPTVSVEGRHALWRGEAWDLRATAGVARTRVYGFKFDQDGSQELTRASVTNLTLGTRSLYKLDAFAIEASLRVHLNLALNQADARDFEIRQDTMVDGAIGLTRDLGAHLGLGVDVTGRWVNLSTSSALGGTGSIRTMSTGLNLRLQYGF